MPETTNKEYRTYLRERFGEESTLPDVVKRVVQDITKSPLASSQRLFEGESNEVYDVRAEGGVETIVRVSRKGPLGFQREKWAVEQCRKAGVLVPRILGIKSIQHGEETLCVCVENKLRGQPLAHLLVEQGPEALRPLIIKAGGELSKIHSIKTRGYGRLDAFGQGERVTWAEAMLQVEEKSVALRAAARKIGLEPEAIDKGLGILNQHQPIYANISPRLLHGDFDPVHILIENQEITGIVDFEDCCSGDPAYDFAWWDFFRGRELPTEWLMKGYTNKEEFGKSFSLRVSLAGLCRGLELVEYYAQLPLPHHPSIRILKEYILRKLREF